MMARVLFIVNTQTSYNGFNEASFWVPIRGHEQSHDKQKGADNGSISVSRFPLLNEETCIISTHFIIIYNDLQFKVNEP
jgi:hypothetical protein